MTTTNTKWSSTLVDDIVFCILTWIWIEIFTLIRTFARIIVNTWWRHQIETLSALLVICTGNSLVTGEFPAQRPVTRSFDVFFNLRLNERLSKQWWGWRFGTPSWPLWRHCHDKCTQQEIYTDLALCCVCLWLGTYQFTGLALLASGRVMR